MAMILLDRALIQKVFFKITDYVEYVATRAVYGVSTRRVPHRFGAWILSRENRDVQWRSQRGG